MYLILGSLYLPIFERELKLIFYLVCVQDHSSFKPLSKTSGFELIHEGTEFSGEAKGRSPDDLKC